MENRVQIYLRHGKKNGCRRADYREARAYLTAFRKAFLERIS